MNDDRPREGFLSPKRTASDEDTGLEYYEVEEEAHPQRVAATLVPTHRVRSVRKPDSAPRVASAKLTIPWKELCLFLLGFISATVLFL